MAHHTLVSDEAQSLQAVLARSPVAFAYFDGGDRLRFWNSAYENLNFRIKDLIREGAFFPDLLAELVLCNQIQIPPGGREQWVEERLEARRKGNTAFRRLTDGRTFLVQERHDNVGGILGFWLDVSNLVITGALKIANAPIGGTQAMLSDHGKQDQIRSQLQTILGCLETLGSLPVEADRADLLGEAIDGVHKITRTLDRCRQADT